MAAAVQQGDRAVCLAARTADAYATYPPHQRQTEALINQRCGEAFGGAGDYSYGPFSMPPAVAGKVALVPDDLGWGWRHCVFATAHRLGHQLALIDGDFECPPDQRTEDDAERSHRDRQLAQNRAGLTLGLAAPLEPRASG
jgi:hypothetical protein